MKAETHHGAYYWQGAQLSLVAEPEVALTIRVEGMREGQQAICSASIERPDGTWIACTVKPRTRGTEALIAALASLTEEYVPQFVRGVFL